MANVASIIGTARKEKSEHEARELAKEEGLASQVSVGPDQGF